MGKGSRIKAQRRESAKSNGGKELSDVRKTLVRRGSERSDREIALWLARAVWRQQTDMNCIDASYTLSAALDLFGITNRVAPVAVVAGHVASGQQAVCGRAAAQFLDRNGGLPPGRTWEPPAGAPDFWVDGGHALVICEGLDLILDPTFDQFRIERLPFLYAPFSHGHFDGEDFWQYTFGGDAEQPEAVVTYLEVGDVIELDEGARFLSSVAARELTSVGLAVDFDQAVVDEGTHALYPSARFLDGIMDQLDEGDFSTLERFRDGRARSLSALGHQDEVPVSWTIAPR